MKIDDLRIQTLDSLIKKGQEVAYSEHPSSALASKKIVNPILFTSWTTQVAQFFMDNISEKNAFVDQFNAMVLYANERLPAKENIRLGVRILQDLKIYLIEKPIKSISKKEKSKISHERRIFIVHGHDDTLKNEVELFLKSLDLEPIILHKQADLGKTIIEKVEHYSDVGFAVILLTNDDAGGSTPDEGYDVLRQYYSTPNPTPSLSEKDRQVVSTESAKFMVEILLRLKPRARQNVIFEFGYFIAKLGRNRVAALCKEEIERPSDIDGLLYTPLDQSGKWMKKLAREINAAGIEIDEKYLT